LRQRTSRAQATFARCIGRLPSAGREALSKPSSTERPISTSRIAGGIIHPAQDHLDSATTAVPGPEVLRLVVFWQEQRGPHMVQSQQNRRKRKRPQFAGGAWRGVKQENLRLLLQNAHQSSFLIDGGGGEAVLHGPAREERGMFLSDTQRHACTKKCEARGGAIGHTPTSWAIETIQLRPSQISEKSPAARRRPSGARSTLAEPLKSVQISSLCDPSCAPECPKGEGGTPLQG
jgi:hypothetical protein